MAGPLANSEGGGPVKPAVQASDRLPAIWVVHLAGISGSFTQCETKSGCLPSRAAPFGGLE